MKFEYSSGAFVYRNKDGKRQYLFLKSEEGWLGIPKGHIEKGETAEQAAMREIREESGLDVALDKFFRDKFSYWFVFNNEKIHKDLTVFLARLDGKPKVTISEEHAGFKWLTYAQSMKQLKYRNLKGILKRVDDYINRQERMEELNSEYAELPNKTSGWDLSKTLVPGEGPLDADVVLLGQAPGRNEDIQRRPFIGVSGRLLDHMIQVAGLKRDRVYILSTVQFFPPENRAPTDEEIEWCRPFLMRQIKVIKPKIVVLLGSVASKEMLGIANVMSEHGKVAEKDGIAYLVTIHPAAAIRMKKFTPLLEQDFRKLKGLAKFHG